jgi:DNA modification methylase
LPQSIDQFINQILCGDACRVLRQFPDESIDCIVTSPPYWALRDYGVKGQLGLEPSFHEYILKLCDIFDEVKRVLKPTGTCWVNLGDTYYANHGSGNEGLINAEVTKQLLSIRNRTRRRELPEKCLCQIPSRFAIEMVNRGWILRNEIIWHKTNSMPGSAKDRFTVNFEKIFFFVKDEQYWFDLDAVREPHNKKQKQEGMKRAREFGYSGNESYKDWYFHRRKKTSWVARSSDLKIGFGAARGVLKTKLIHPSGKAKRCVWSIPTKPFTGRHYAVYPPELIETPIKAGCPKGGIVLDPFMGSGTTAMVARKLGRNFIGVDLNPEYIKMAKARLGQQPLPLVF